MVHKVQIDLPEGDLREDTIVAAVAGRHPTITPSAALSLLATVDVPGADRQGLLRDAVRDDGLDPQVRAGAVQVYTRVAGAESVPDLVSVLDDRTGRVVVAAATALGRVGTPDELDALRRLRGDGSELLHARVTFAEDLIVHRFGLTDRAVAPPPVEVLPAPSATGALVFSGARPGIGRRDRVLSAIKRELPALDVGNQDVYEVQCGPRLLEIAVSRDFVGLEGMATLRSRPAAPAVIAVQNQEHDDFYPSLIALSDPDGKGGVTVRFSRLSGDVVYVAEGTSQGDGLELELSTARAPGATPVAGRIRVTANAVEISGISGSRAIPARTPRAL
jgi:hypothetical protein